MRRALLLPLIGTVVVLVLTSCGGGGSVVQKEVQKAKAAAIPDGATYAPQDADVYSDANLAAPGAGDLVQFTTFAQSHEILTANGAGESVVPFDKREVDQSLDNGALILSSPMPWLTGWAQLEHSVKSRWTYWQTATDSTFMFSVTEPAGVQSWVRSLRGTKVRLLDGFTIYLTNDGFAVAVSSSQMIVLGDATSSAGAVARLKAALDAHAGTLPSLASDPGFRSALALAEQTAPVWQWLRGGTVAQGILATFATEPLPEAVARTLFGDGDVVATTTWRDGAVKVKLVGTRVGAYSSYGHPWRFSDFRQSTQGASLAVRVGGIGDALPALLSALDSRYPELAANSAEIANVLRGGLQGGLSGLGYRVTLIPHEVVEASNYLQQLSGSPGLQHTFSDSGELSVNVRNGTIEVEHQAAEAPAGAGLSDALVAAADLPDSVNGAVYLDLQAVVAARRGRIGSAYKTSWVDHLTQLLLVAYARADKRPEVDLTAQVTQP